MTLVKTPAGENWTLELSHASPEYKKMKEERKRLTFTMPRDSLHSEWQQWSMFID